MMIETSQRELLEVIDTLLPPRRFARGLNRRQEQRHQNADDRDHDQQFNQRKTE
jgi:hypothetical protein